MRNLDRDDKIKVGMSEDDMVGHMEQTIDEDMVMEWVINIYYPNPMA